MQNHTSTCTPANKGELTSITINVIPSDIQVTDWEFLGEWATRLGVTLEDLLKRILLAAVIGQLYAEKIPEL